MAQQFVQLRFYTEEASSDPKYAHNNPSGSNLIDEWSNGTVFSNFLPITQLGIQAPPGTKFYINGSGPAVVGYTGLFEIDLSNGGEIISLSFEKDSLQFINNNPNAWLIVDIVYESEED